MPTRPLPSPLSVDACPKCGRPRFGRAPKLLQNDEFRVKGGRWMLQNDEFPVKWGRWMCDGSVPVESPAADESLRVVCPRCGYAWLEACADAGTSSTPKDGRP